MNPRSNPRIVLAHDWLTGMRGGEKCLEVVARRWPDATLFTLLHRAGSVSPAIEQLPRSAHAEEAEPLRAELDRIQAGRRRGPQLLGDILPIVLARLGVGALPSRTSGEQHPT